ncbi:MAG TPA: Gfo/Idh/MocA family oxidoreductase [Candidatus Synoicihabitans sp.]|nr:Gfo/Idh/MocA family oxidoreductase [Candidatus Synoicihabitans sp.]
MKPLRVGLVGIGGYGKVHLQHLLEFHARGELCFVAAVVLPIEAETETAAQLDAVGCVRLPTFDALIDALPRLHLDLCVVPTPIHLHARMAMRLMEAGVSVLVEKPAAASPVELARMAQTAASTGRTLAVGFQYLHAPEVQTLKQRLLAGEIGELRRLSVYGAWPRSHSYYTRNNWAGRLRLGEDWVLDSPVNNAMSHFLMLMLFLAGPTAETAIEPISLTAELYRAQRIESFDTAALEFESAHGCQLDFYGTHSSLRTERPTLRIEGTTGNAEWVQDSHASIIRARSTWLQQAKPESTTRERMYRAVLARCRGQAAFICSAPLAAAHLRCVWALQTHVPIHPIETAHHQDREEQGERFTFVPGLDRWLKHAADRRCSLSAAGSPWAATPTRAAIAPA